MSHGVRIRKARQRLNLTQAGLADLVSVHQSSVAYWEGEKTRPRVATLRQLAEVLKVAPEWLEFGANFGPAETQIPVLGALSRDSARNPRQANQRGAGESLSAFLDGTRLVSVRIADDSLNPAYCCDDHVLGPLLSGEDVYLAAGRDAVVQYWDGRFILTRLALAPAGAARAAGSGPSEAGKIAWCMPVEWIRRAAPEGPARALSPQPDDFVEAAPPERVSAE